MNIIDGTAGLGDWNISVFQSDGNCCLQLLLFRSSSMWCLPSSQTSKTAGSGTCFSVASWHGWPRAVKRRCGCNRATWGLFCCCTWWPPKSWSRPLGLEYLCQLGDTLAILKASCSSHSGGFSTTCHHSARTPDTCPRPKTSTMSFSPAVGSFGSSLSSHYIALTMK